MLHAVVNPDDVVQDNLLTACHNTDELRRCLLDVRAGADTALAAVAAAVRGDAPRVDDAALGVLPGVLAPSSAEAATAASDAESQDEEEDPAGEAFGACSRASMFRYQEQRAHQVRVQTREGAAASSLTIAIARSVPDVCDQSASETATTSSMGRQVPSPLAAWSPRS